jgi:hypothetical protein
VKLISEELNHEERKGKGRGAKKKEDAEKKKKVIGHVRA